VVYDGLKRGLRRLQDLLKIARVALARRIVGGVLARREVEPGARLIHQVREGIPVLEEAVHGV